jgi:membrane fusion protein (multidrug efflux system)
MLNVIRQQRFILMSILSCMLLSGCQNTKTENRAQTPEVTVVTVTTQKVALTTEIPGRVVAHLVAEIRPKVGGIITKRLFVEGTDVKAGDLLYQIDPAPYQASYNNAKAALRKAEANLVPIKSKAERYKELIAIKGVSQQEYDDARAAQEQAEAEIEANIASVETARINLQDTKVTAPITGSIGKSSITVGALVTASQSTSLATIHQLDPIFVDATQSSANLLRLKHDFAAGRMQKNGYKYSPVKLLLEDGTQYPLEGHLDFSEMTVDSGTGSYIVRMSFSNPKRLIMPGMYVRAIIEQGTAEKAILVSQQAVSRDTKGNPYVLLVDQQNKVQQRIIVVDRTIGDKWFVTSGLNVGDRVIIEGSQKARPGALVKSIDFVASTKGGK